MSPDLGYWSDFTRPLGEIDHGRYRAAMRIPAVLFLASAAALAAIIARPEWGDFVVVAGPAVLASLWLCWRSWRTRKPILPRVVVDGSNVMHWKDGKPQIETVREVVTHLRAQGVDPVVMFDANAGYLVAGRYQHDHAMAQRLGIPTKSVYVVPKGTPADQTILGAARDMRARVVSNDRFRDWADRHPEVNSPGHVIRGGYDGGGLWLDMNARAGQGGRPVPPAQGRKLAS